MEKNKKPYFWISSSGREDEDVGRARGVHCSFQTPSTQAVQAWYAKCIELGGKDNGRPGLLPEYQPGYYGGFIIDLDG